MRGRGGATDDDGRLASDPTIHSSRVLRQMDHFIMALKTDPSHERPDFLLSLYEIRYTIEPGAQGAGHVAYAWWSGSDDGRDHGQTPREAILTDSTGLAIGLGSRLRPGRWSMEDPERTPLVARFERRILSPYGIGYRILAEGLDIDARWEDFDEPVFASGPTRTGEAWISTQLMESLRPSATIGGHPQPGTSFPDPIWRPWFGTDRGSCIVGLGETIYEPRAALDESASG